MKVKLITLDILIAVFIIVISFSLESYIIPKLDILLITAIAFLAGAILVTYSDFTKKISRRKWTTKEFQEYICSFTTTEKERNILICLAFGYFDKHEISEIIHTLYEKRGFHDRIVRSMQDKNVYRLLQHRSILKDFVTGMSTKNIDDVILSLKTYVILYSLHRDALFYLIMGYRERLEKEFGSQKTLELLINLVRVLGETDFKKDEELIRTEIVKRFNTHIEILEKNQKEKVV